MTYLTYDELGRPTRRHDPRRTVVTYAYGQGGHRTELTVEGQGTVYYEYGPTGNMDRLLDGKTGLLTYYEYDPAGRIRLQHHPNATATYFLYDLAGRLSEKVTRKDSDASVLVRFAYTRDAAGNPIAIEESTGLSYFAWDQNGMNLLCERDATGAVVAEYAHGETPTTGIGSLTAGKKADGGGTEYQYPVYDHRGTVMRLTDTEGSVTATYEYDAWGVALHEQESGAPNRFRYQSNWIALTDSDATLFLSPTRLYGAHLGRFSNADPVSRRQSARQYLGFAGQPPGYVDPSGLIVQDPKDTYEAFYAGGQLYTCNCGWIDQQHLVPMLGHVEGVYVALTAGEMKGVVSVTGVRPAPILGIPKYRWWYKFRWELIGGSRSDREAQICTAERIANAGLLYWELAQWTSPVMRFARTPFSLEDPPSNYIGARLAAQYLRSLEDPASASEGGFIAYLRAHLEAICGTSLEGHPTWDLFKERGWDSQLVYDGRKPVLIPKSDPADCCPLGSEKARLFDQPWCAGGFSGSWEVHWYWIELPPCDLVRWQ